LILVGHAAKVSTMLKHNHHFDGKVQSIGFSLAGRRHTMGVVEAGEFRLDIGTAERTTIICGQLAMRVVGEPDWNVYGPGTSFDAGKGTQLELRVEQPTGYHCEFFD
jgi:purine/pyrimidine-nucleoside phosphorylase